MSPRTKDVRCFGGPILLSLATGASACRASHVETLRMDAGAESTLDAAGTLLVGPEGAAMPSDEQRPPVNPLAAWVSSDLYELRVDAPRYCPGANGASGLDGGNSVLLGAKVQIRAKVDEFFVAPRHASLRDGGILFQAKLGETKASCGGPPLKPTPLRKGQVASGFVLFELPARRDNLVLDFQPARWGGAGLVRVDLGDVPDAR